MLNQFTSIAEGEPSRALAGDTWIWQRTDLSQAYSPTLYTLAYALKREGDASAPAMINGAMVVSVGGIFTVTVPSATTTALASGRWRWSAFVTRTSDSARIEVATGLLDVLPNRASATEDPRSYAKKVLDAIESLMQGKSASDVSSYSIAGRSLTKLTLEELIKARDYFRNEVISEQNAERSRQGKSTGRILAARFTR